MSSGSEVVGRYLAGLADNDWDAVEATLAPDVERRGPYRDDITGRDAYIAFLRQTVESLSGYVLAVERVVDASPTLVVELNETVDAGGGRLRTEEAVVFDVAAGGIIRVAVYLRASERTAAT